MTSWRNTTIEDLQKQGFRVKTGVPGPDSPTPMSPRSRSSRASGRGDALRGVFATALQQRFPGVFQPMPDLSFDWGSVAHGLGIVWGTLVHRPAHKNWTIMPLWGEDLRTSNGTFSEKKLREVMKRVEGLMDGKPHKKHCYMSRDAREHNC